MSHARERERAEDEAALWLILLSEEPNDEDARTRFEAWRAQSSLNAEIWARTERAYALVGKTPRRHRSHPEPCTASGRGESRSSRAYAGPERRSRRRGPPARVSSRRLTIAAAAVLATIVAVALLPGALLRLEADVVTSTGEQRSVRLADGSLVELAPESAIRIAFDDRLRLVRLVKGNAFFEVSPDPVRPFRVTAADTAATVLGTAFEMRRGDTGAGVSVASGRVQVEDGSTTPPTRADLIAGHWIHVTWHGPVSRGLVSAERIAAWRRGEMIVRDRPADDVVDALRPYYAGLILMRADALAARRVSGIYSLRDPISTLRELAASYGATVRQVSPWLVIVSNS